MTSRVAAWVLVIATLWAVYSYGGAVKNPWGGLMAPPASSVLQSLPPSGPGCGEKCQ